MEKAPYAKQEKIERIEFLESEIKDLRKKLENFELDEENYSDQFDELLDEQFGEISICGALYSPSTILKEVDPINYRCSLTDFVNSFDIEETEEYKDLQEELEELEMELERLLPDQEETEETE
jgi:hypothetical protein